MQLPVKAHYATVAMLAMAAEFETGRLVVAREIAEQHAVPNQFLVQILQQLRSAGLVQAVRGSSGGFRLTHAPKHTKLSDIVDAVCPASLGIVADSSHSAIQNAVCQLWSDMARREQDFLQSITLNDLLEQTKSTASTMFYI